jgi:leucyl/phenylalanyl-tRNA--protein transferase
VTQTDHLPTRPADRESVRARGLRYALGLAYLVRPVRVSQAPLIALGTLREMAFGSPPLEQRRPVGVSGFAGIAADRSPGAILAAAKRGFFPLHHMGPVKLWSPPERPVIPLSAVPVGKRLRKALRTSRYAVSFDQAFCEVMTACAAPRPGRVPLTSVTPMMRRIYADLFACGHAHSVEVWDETGALVGGLFGMTVGPVFMVMSMFHRAESASKFAFISLAHHLEAWGFTAVDAMKMSPSVAGFGGRMIPRDAFESILREPEPANAPLRWRPAFSLGDTAAWAAARNI